MLAVGLQDAVPLVVAKAFVVNVGDVGRGKEVAVCEAPVPVPRKTLQELVPTVGSLHDWVTTKSYLPSPLMSNSWNAG